MAEAGPAAPTGGNRRRPNGCARSAATRQTTAETDVREHRLALHQPAIAIRRFVARRPPVDQHDLLAALLQMHRDRDADHAGAEDHYIALQCAHSAARRFGFVLPAAGAVAFEPRRTTALRRSHSSAASPIVFAAPLFIPAIKSRSNLKSPPHSDWKKRRTFWVLR